LFTPNRHAGAAEEEEALGTAAAGSRGCTRKGTRFTVIVICRQIILCFNGPNFPITWCRGDGIDKNAVVATMACWNRVSAALAWVSENPRPFGVSFK